MDQVTPQLRDDPAAAFTTYADLCEDFLVKAHAGTPYDTGNLLGQEKGFSLPIDILVGIVIGIAIAFFIVGRQKAALKTVRREAAAKNYMRPGSLNLTARNEQFLYNTVDRIEKSRLPETMPISAPPVRYTEAAAGSSRRTDWSKCDSLIQ